MLRNHKGFTMVELIVVIAILGVMAVATGISVNSVFSTRERACINEIEGLLSQCRVLAMSGADEPALLLSLEDDGLYATLSTAAGVNKRASLGSESIQLGYTLQDGTDAVVDSTHSLALSFYRETGALKPLEDVAGNSLTGWCTQIRAGNFTVEITPTTGYHRLGP